MLAVSKNVFKGKMLIYVADYYLIKSIAKDTSKRHRTIVCRIISHHLYTFACRQSFGTLPWTADNCDRRNDVMLFISLQIIEKPFAKYSVTRHTFFVVPVCSRHLSKPQKI